MAHSLRSRWGREKRARKRVKLMPREIARLQRLSKTDQEALKLQLASKEAQIDTSRFGHVRKRKVLIRHKHVRSMRSGPKAYETKEITKAEYVPQPRDYSKILEESASDSDDNDMLSDNDEDFQKRSRKRDPRDSEAKSKITNEDGALEREIKKYRKKNKNRFPKWANKGIKKMCTLYSKKQKMDEDDAIFDWS